MEEDPINHFFTPTEVEDPKILYTTLAIPSTATPEEIRKSYRKQALRLHPDKTLGTKSDKEKEELGKAFQRVGFAYAVLSDEAKRKRYVEANFGQFRLLARRRRIRLMNRYDATGRTDDKFLDAEEMGWDAYFGTLFERLDGKMLKEHKAKYQGEST
jgi:DnaJ family protein C protein 9